MDAATQARTQVGTERGKSHSPANHEKRQGGNWPHAKVVGRIKPFNTIGWREQVYAARAISGLLSGYLGGEKHGGYWVERLADEWSQTFGVRHAVPCNSATSGLLMACMAVEIGPGDEVWTTPTSMSATAAVAKVLGATVKFIDIEPLRFSLNLGTKLPGPPPKAIIVANIFGHPAYLSAMRAWCSANKVWMIEDNAQSPMAKEYGQYAGTIGHIGVFSLNVHKHIQCGEGGVVVTNNYDLWIKCTEAMNHGELAPGITGLNLRMTEPTAAIACSQLKKAPGIIAGRRALAHELSDAVRNSQYVTAPVEDMDCVHVYYLWVARVMKTGLRSSLVNILRLHGVPFRSGYSIPINLVFGGDCCPVAERMENSEFMVFEICGWAPTKKQVKIIKEVLRENSES